MHSHANPLEKFSSLIMSVFFGAAMIIMFLFREEENSRGLISLLAPWIQYTVLTAGGLLLLLSFFQLVGVWMQPATTPAVNDHDHKHGPECAHHHHDHDHKREGEEQHHDEGCHHEHHHEPGHEHTAACGHDHGHDHGWNPIRFVPLVIPLILCLMGLPNERMIRAYEKDLGQRNIEKGEGGGFQANVINEVNPAVGLVNVGFSLMTADGMGAPLSPLADVATHWAFRSDWAKQQFNLLEWQNWDSNVKPTVADMDMLERIAENRAQHNEWRAKPSVEVEGMIYPGDVIQKLEDKEGKNRQQFFRIVRLRVACCLGDATPATMPCLYRSTLGRDIAPGDWVAVRGRLEFATVGGKTRAVMRVYEVQKRPIPPKPYL
jgi:hypothetical protein